MMKTGVVVEVQIWRPASQGDQSLPEMVSGAVDAALLNVFALLAVAGIADGRECTVGDRLGSVVLSGVRRYRVDSMEPMEGRTEA